MHLIREMKITAEFRALMMDEWDWSSGFRATNAVYSQLVGSANEEE